MCQKRRVCTSRAYLGAYLESGTKGSRQWGWRRRVKHVASVRTASYIGFFVMVAVAVASFMLFDEWWLTAVGVLVALGIGWYSLGLYARASTISASRMIRGAATDEDYAEIGRLGPAAAREATRAAADAPDPQRDRLYGEFLIRAGGVDAAQELVIEHMARAGFTINPESAYDLLERWRKYGIVRNESLGEFLDDQAHHLDEVASDAVRSERVFAVVDLRRSQYHEGGDEIEVFADRGSAERYLDDLRERGPKLAARVRIEERRRGPGV